MEINIMEVYDKIDELFELNYEMLRMEGGHSMTQDIRREALSQVKFYFRKLQDVATNVTETEVKLSLPEQKSPDGRNYTLEGIVDIVKERDEVVMYDIKTHDPGYVKTNKELYQKQLNVYAHIWQKLRKNQLDKTAIVATQYPKSLKAAAEEYPVNLPRLEYELNRWDPVIEIELDESSISSIIEDFGEVVDSIENKKFKPASIEELEAKEVNSNKKFATRVCRNCDARYSCSSYREFATKKYNRRFDFRHFFKEDQDDGEQSEWLDANVDNIENENQ